MRVMTSAVPGLNEGDCEGLVKKRKENPGESESAAHTLALAQMEDQSPKSKSKRSKYLEKRNWGPQLGARLRQAV